MGMMLQTQIDSGSLFHFKRPRLNRLFMHAINYPFITVCAGAGYGKTTAVHDFVQEYQAITIWVQLSERDNVGGRFWENFTHTMNQLNPPFARAISKLGFPDTPEKLSQYHSMMRDLGDKKRRIIVFDDCHVIENPEVIRFVESAFRSMPTGTTLIMISRSSLRISTAGLASNNNIFTISEEDLCFSENELFQYFRSQGISLKPENLRGIMQDTGGWAFALNLIARSYNKAPGYEGYLRSAMKTNIFQFMEVEIWDTISRRLQIFLVRLSLIDHLSVDLIVQLAGKEKDLIDELERQNAYIRRDSYINAYLIHPLFLEFIASKQEQLSDEQKRETYTVAGEWCNKNGFKIDALSYYEKNGDYLSITGMFIGSRSQIPYDIASYTAAIFERAPQEVFDTVLYLASIHLRVVMCQARWDDTIKLAEYYEKRYTNMPLDEFFKRETLSSIYYCWGISRGLMCLTDDRYDFDLYFKKLDQCFSEPIDPGILINRNPGGPWICTVGSSKKGAPEEYIAAMERSTGYLTHCFLGFESGKDELARAELLFYKNDTDAAEMYIARSLGIALERKQFGIAHRALFYTLRIAFFQGNYAKAIQALKDMEANLDETDYHNRYTDYDISLCWYYCALGISEKVPDWLKEKFSIYGHASFIENFANQMKARYCYITRNFLPLLSYIHEMKQRESFLFGRVEMLAIEACVYYRIKDRDKAFSILEEAYNTASPNNLWMPFIELGKDMRTLTAFALKKSGGTIPKTWLENISRKSAYYAKRLANVIWEFKQDNYLTDDIVISPREKEVLADLSHGLSRTEIAVSRSLSVNTVKMVINNIYSKLGAENVADAVRIASERKLI